MTNLPVTKDSIMPVQNLINLDSIQLTRQLFDIMLVYGLLSYNIISPELLAQVTVSVFPPTIREIKIFLPSHPLILNHLWN